MATTPPPEELPTVDDLDELVQLVSEQSQPFIRYSGGPERDGRNGTSRDYEADCDMPGLSVTTVAPEPWWTGPAKHWVARRVCKYDELGDEHDRFPWLLTGRIVGYGPDHEPLVADVVPIAKIGPRALAEAKKVYQQHFNVAEDSRPVRNERSDR